MKKIFAIFALLLISTASVFASTGSVDTDYFVSVKLTNYTKSYRSVSYNYLTSRDKLFQDNFYIGGERK